MGKAVVHGLFATAFIALYIFSASEPNGLNNHHQLHRRLGYKVRPPTFDPLLTEIERVAEEKGFSYHDDDNGFHLDQATLDMTAELADAYQYFTEGGKLNATLRLLYLFPLLDRTPKDGFVSFHELVTWNTRQAIERINYFTEKELIAKDENKDSLISFKEYLPQFGDDDIERGQMEHGEAGWWRERFNSGDHDHDGLLNFKEFRDFLHPEDSTNNETQAWLIKEGLKRLDIDKDGKLSFDDFRDQIYHNYRVYAEFETAGTDVTSPEEKFAELDKDKDLFLSVEELRPVLPYLQPGEVSHARYYTHHLINQADDNGDGKLTVYEMLNNEWVFYNTVYGDGQEEDYENDHDEL